MKTHEHTVEYRVVETDGGRWAVERRVDETTAAGWEPLRANPRRVQTWRTEGEADDIARRQVLADVAAATRLGFTASHGATADGGRCCVVRVRTP